MPIDYSKRLFNLTDDELERFMTDWVAAKVRTYVDHERFSGPGDKGRDVVGYLTKQRLDGKWHNFQCKQLRKPLGEPEFFTELGKIFFHSAARDFSLPTRMYFAAPRGAVRKVRNLIALPSTIGPALLASWDNYCTDKIEVGLKCDLTPEIVSLINDFDFSAVELLDADKLVRFPEVLAVLVKWFDEDPGAYPQRDVPTELAADEAPYIGELIAAYSERNRSPIASPSEALAHADHGPHLRDQRTRYFEADAFSRYYRDNTPPGTVEDFNDQVYHGVVDESRGTHKDALECVDKVMKLAASLSPSGRLGKYAKISVKQGTCHHLVNARRLRWKR